MTGDAPRVAGRTSVVLTDATGRGRLRKAVAALLEHDAGHDVEIVVAAGGLGQAGLAALRAAGAVVVSLPSGPSLPTARNRGAAAASGEHVLFLDASCRVRAGWLTGLLDELRDREVAGVQPLLVRPDETIACAGLAVVAPGMLPAVLLEGHQRDDALPVAAERLAAVSGSALLVRAEDLMETGGFDEGFDSSLADLDLCLRLGHLRGGSFRLVPQVVVTQEHETSWSDRDRARLVEQWRGRLPEPDPDVYRRLQLHLAGIGSDHHDVPAARVSLGRDPDRPADRLRWSLKLPSTRGHWGDRWGDTHFANGLARALRALGQDVVICRLGAHDAGPTHLDDVSLTVRGLHPAPPVPGQTNVLWVISHPDDVDPDELSGYDLVFAASAAWSRAMGERSGREVLPLLQASEFAPAPPVRLPPPEDREVVFVGSTHDGRRRRLVEDAVASGIPLAVHGAGWEGLVPDHVWKSEYVPNEDLPALYRRHGLVLADHWPDMAANGFVANRVFDAMAAGARVLSDDVVGIEQRFGPDLVRVCRGPDDLRDSVLGWPTESGQESPVTGLTFADRARVLLDAVLVSRSGRSRPTG